MNYQQYTHLFEKHGLQLSLNNALRHRVWFLGCPVQGQGLDSKILTGPFQLSVFYDTL